MNKDLESRIITLEKLVNEADSNNNVDNLIVSCLRALKKSRESMNAAQAAIAATLIALLLDKVPEDQKNAFIQFALSLTKK